jgi:hypothetical protein
MESLVRPKARKYKSARGRDDNIATRLEVRWQCRKVTAAKGKARNNTANVLVAGPIVVDVALDDATNRPTTPNAHVHNGRARCTSPNGKGSSTLSQRVGTDCLCHCRKRMANKIGQAPSKPVTLGGSRKEFAGVVFGVASQVHGQGQNAARLWLHRIGVQMLWIPALRPTLARLGLEKRDPQSVSFISEVVNSNSRG